MKARQLELTIDQLVLHDMPTVSRHRLLAAIEDTLLRLVTEGGLPPDTAPDTIFVPATSVQIEPGASVETIAGQIARSVYAGLRPGTAGATPSGHRQPGTPDGFQPGEATHA